MAGPWRQWPYRRVNRASWVGLTTPKCAEARRVESKRFGCGASRFRVRGSIWAPFSEGSIAGRRRVWGSSPVTAACPWRCFTALPRRRVGRAVGGSPSAACDRATAGFVRHSSVKFAGRHLCPARHCSLCRRYRAPRSAPCQGKDHGRVGPPGGALPFRVADLKAWRSRQRGKVPIPRGLSGCTRSGKNIESEIPTGVARIAADRCKGEMGGTTPILSGLP